MPFTQKNRKIQISTPLAQDTLLFYRMQGKEQLGALFEYELELLSTDPAIEPESLLGQSVTVSMELPNLAYRYFNGYISRFCRYGNLGELNHYRASVRPWLWFLTRNSNCRIFQKKSAVDIIKEVFENLSISFFVAKLSGNYPKREYCVQYRESDFNFVSRLMEEEGIYYYFTHEKDHHKLVLCDGDFAHESFPSYQQIPFHQETSGAANILTDYIHNWGYSREVKPGVYTLTDYDFKKPRGDLLVKSDKCKEHALADFECFDYPGGYTETGAGEHLVQMRIEEQHARFECHEGTGNARGLGTGYMFKLTDHPRPEQNCQYLVVSTNYHLQINDYLSNVQAADGDIYHCSFTALDCKYVYRSSRHTPKPLMFGSQTAVVVGPEGDEIHTDLYGRVKVQFHWDRYGKKNEDSSCWIRVSHPWAGKGWGGISIPRIGQEVIVSFLEGDPDQPIITGRVYNGVQMPPFPLPGAGVISGIKSNTHKGSGFNEFSMDDTAGKEKITIHGQYDMNTTVLHDQTTTVKNNRTDHILVDDSLTVDANRTVHIKGKLSETIDKGQEVTVTKGYKETINDGATSTINAGLTSTVNGQWKNTVNGHLNETVTSGEEQKVDGGKKLTVTGGFTEDVTGDRTTTVTGPTKETATDSITLEVGGSVIKISPSSISISSNGSNITLDAAGVSVSGVKISLNG